MGPRDRILARRAKFMAAAIVGIAGCSSESSTTTTPQACLKFAPDAAADARDASSADTEPQACLFAPNEDTGVEPTDTSTGDAPEGDG